MFKSNLEKYLCLGVLIVNIFMHIDNEAAAAAFAAAAIVVVWARAGSN